MPGTKYSVRFSWGSVRRRYEPQMAGCYLEDQAFGVARTKDVVYNYEIIHDDLEAQATQDERMGHYKSLRVELRACIGRFVFSYVHMIPDMSYHHHSSISSARRFNVSGDMLLIPSFLIKKLNLSLGKGLVKMSASCIKQSHSCCRSTEESY
ncbi:hypothetical protein Tco_0640128 [Tanacetum coccineum]